MNTHSGPLYQDDNVPPLPQGFVLDAHPAQAANDAAPPLPQGFTPDQPVMDNSGTQVEGGFSDELPSQPVSRMAPEDEQALQAMVSQGATASQVRQFAASKGFQYPNAEQVVEAFAKTGRINPDAVYQMPKPMGPDEVGSFARGAADSLTMGALPKLNAVATAVGGALSGEGSFGDLYGRNLDTNNGIIEGDEENHPWVRVAGQLLGGMVLPSGMEGVGLKVGTDVLKAGGTMQEARVAAKIAVRNRMAAVGGAFGAAHGAGSEDTLGDAAGGALTEGALGLATGGLLGQGGRSVKAEQKIASTASNGQDVLEAATKQEIPVLPADVGGPIVRGLTAFTAQTPFGAGPIIKGAQAANDAGGVAVDRVAANMGDAVQDVEALGTAATEGALKYGPAAKRMGGRLYDIANEKSEGTMIDLAGAREVLDSQIARLEAVPLGGAGLAETKSLRAALNRPYSVQGVRDMRTEMFVPEAFRNTPVEGRLKAVVNAAARDVETGLRAQGKGDAADAFAAADQHWRQTLVNLKRNIEPIIGPLDRLNSAEAVATKLNSALKNNGARLASFVNSLPAEQQGVVRASLLNPLGRTSDGAFSLSKFSDDWAKVSPGAKRLVFGAEGRAALDEVATVGSGAKAAKAYGNSSNTGRAVITDRVVGSLATGATMAAGMKTLGLTLAAQYGLARLLSHPGFARWVARAPKSSLSPVAYADRLTRIARAEPAIANDVLGLQKQLVSAFSAAPMRAAAEQPGQELSGTQGNAGQQQGPAEDAQP